MGFQEVGYALPAIQNTVSTIGNLQQMDMLKKKFEQETALNAPKVDQAKNLQALRAKEATITKPEDLGVYFPEFQQAIVEKPHWAKNFYDHLVKSGAVGAGGRTTVGMVQDTFQSALSNQDTTNKLFVQAEVQDAYMGLQNAQKRPQLHFLHLGAHISSQPNSFRNSS